MKKCRRFAGLEDEEQDEEQGLLGLFISLFFDLGPWAASVRCALSYQCCVVSKTELRKKTAGTRVTCVERD